MQRGKEPKIDDAIKEIAALLAAAYERRLRIRLINAQPVNKNGPRREALFRNIGSYSDGRLGHRLAAAGEIYQETAVVPAAYSHDEACTLQAVNILMRRL